MNIIRSRIAVKVAVSTALVMFLILTVLFFVIYNKDKESIQESAFNEIEAIGLTLIQQIDAEQHEELARQYAQKDAFTEDNQPELFLKSVEPLRSAHDQNDLETDIYTLRLSDRLKEQVMAEPDRIHENGTEFILMSSPTPYYRHGYRYHPKMKEALFNGKTVRVPPYSDEHGIWISFYIPIVSKAGQTVGMLEVDKPMDELFARNRKALYGNLLLVLVLSIVGFLVIMWVSMTIVRHLKKLTVEAEDFGYGNYSTPISVDSHDEVRRLADVLDGARIEISGFITRILNVIPGLMFTFGKDGKIAPHSSRSAKDFADGDITGKPMATTFFDDAKSVKDVADMAFDPNAVLPFKDLMALMPTSLVKEDKEYELSYLPVLNDSQLKDIFVFGRDVTEENRLKKQIADENRLNKMYISIIKNRLLFENFISESEAGFDRAFELLEGGKYGIEEIGELFRITHSLKGSASTLNLFPIAEPAHVFEDELAEIRKQGTIESPEQLKESYENLKEKLRSVIDQMTRLIGVEEDEAKKIEDWEIEALKERLEAGNAPGALELVDGLQYPSLHSYITSKARAVFDSSLEKIDEKDAMLVVQCDKARVGVDVIRMLDVVLSHGIRNALDHGLEEEMERMDVEKDPKGRITVNGTIHDDRLVLEIRDDGRGIDPEVIAGKAVEKGLVSRDDVQKMTDQEKINLVTAPGFSTAAQTTEVSGRGVGMDAVKDKVESSGGKLDILSEVGKGSIMRIEISVKRIRRES